jgi:threonine synthase
MRNRLQKELKKNKRGWNKTDLLPVHPEYVVSIGEGNTPLIKADKLARRIGIEKLLLKGEYCNPTGSFKDRPVSVGISKALEFKYKKVVVASSGNGAASVAAFAAKAGLKALIFIPEATATEKIRQAAFYGAKVIKVEGPYSNSFRLAKEVSQKTGEFLNLTTTFINPYTVEGDKLVAYELFAQMDGIVPDSIFVPIGAGPLLVGIFKGFEELKSMGVIDKLPKMVGVQAEGCSPIARAFIEGRQEVESDDNPSTVAGGICDGLTGYSKDGTYTLSTIRRSKGFALHCNDQSILEAQRWLSEDEGVFVEPSSATAITGIMRSVQENMTGRGETVVALLTGHGLKDMVNVKLNIDVPTVPNDVSKLLELVV